MAKKAKKPAYKVLIPFRYTVNGVVQWISEDGEKPELPKHALEQLKRFGKIEINKG